jgi:predicted N-acyltransferase
MHVSFWFAGSLLLLTLTANTHAFTQRHLLAATVGVHDNNKQQQPRHSSRRRRSLFNPPHVNENNEHSALSASSSFSASSSSSSSSSFPRPKDIRMEFKLHTSIGSIAADDWDACVNAPPAQDSASSPFLEHSWLHTLEASQCASPQTGWAPQHLSISWNGHTFGYVPLYIKGNSLGEFIFDNEWAQAAYQNNINYYPKLLIGVPFTPVTGSRILWRTDLYQHYNAAELAELRVAVGTFLKQSTKSNQLSSVHWNFVTDQEATDLSRSSLLGVGDDNNGAMKDNGKKTLLNIFGRISPTKDDYMRRTSLQYHWRNRNPNNNYEPYESFDDYLQCFKSKRRINIRRERRMVCQDADIIIQAVTGRDILQYDGLVERMFDIYLSTIDKMYYGRQYLTLDFFQKLAQTSFIDNLCFMCARYKSTGEELRAQDFFAGTFSKLSWIGMN